MLYQTNNSWNRSAQKMFRTRQNSHSFESSAAYLFVNKTILRRITKGQIGNPIKQGKNSLYQMNKKFINVKIFISNNIYNKEINHVGFN